MKVLWVTSSNTFYNQNSNDSSTNSYNGVGWVSAQQLEFMKEENFELAIMFPSPNPHDKKRIIDGVSYYPIIEKVNILTHLKRFYFSPKSSYFERVKEQIDWAIEDFSPDLIHVFGLECKLAEIIYSYNIPHTVHLQGLIVPYAESYLPPAISAKSIYWDGKWWRERIFNNGFRFYYNETLRNCKREINLYHSLKHCLGRTHWDKSLISLYAPDAKYCHINEILRPQFYQEKPIKINEDIDILKITSTISNTLYKGLDLVAKTAKVLDELNVKYEWHIIGVTTESDYYGLIENSLGYKFSSNIHFDGVLQASEIINRLNQTDIYVHPSYIDNSPNSICEAQIKGIPVIATNVGGVSSLIDNHVTGILVPTNEPHTLAYNLTNLRKDYKLRKLISENSYKQALERHDRKKIVNQIIDVYRQLITDEK